MKKPALSQDNNQLYLFISNSFREAPGKLFKLFEQLGVYNFELRTLKFSSRYRIPQDKTGTNWI